MWKKENPRTLLVGMEIGTATVENSMEVKKKKKTKIEQATSSSNSTAGWNIQGILLPKESTVFICKEHTHPNVQSSIMYNS